MEDDGKLLALTNLGHVLDHPEAVAWGPDGRIYAGGEDGQLYRLGLTDSILRDGGEGSWRISARPCA